MASNQAGVICSGNIVYDTLVCPVRELTWRATTFVDCIEVHLGGNGSSTARALARLGVPVRLLGAVGNDDQGEYMLEHLRASGVDIGNVERVSTPSSATVAMVSPTGERKFFHLIGASREALSHGIDFNLGLLEGAAHYHMASMFVMPRFRPLAAATLERARKAGLATSFDTNWDPEGTWMRDLAPCLPHIDYLFMNEPEAEMITGSSDPSRAAEIVLAKGLRTAVLKLGGAGCAVFSEGEEIRCPAYEVKVKDTTGAGDCFVAGFLAALLDGASLNEAGQFANAVAALSVGEVGAVNGLQPRTQTAEWMRTARLRA